jgi:hypothetical protein
MSNAGQLITRAQRQLLSGTVEERNKLAASLTATATSMTFTYDLKQVRPGAVVEVDSELLYVWEVNTGTKTATIERGFNGTTATTHTSGAIANVNPRFPRNQLLEAINDELIDLAAPSNGLYRVKALDFDYNGTDLMVNLQSNNDVIDLLEVRYRNTADDYPHVRKVGLIRNLPTKDFPSGVALKFNDPPKSASLRVTYKAPFNRVTRESDDIQTVCGFPLSAEDIIILGIQIRLMAPREMKRSFTEAQGDTRRAEEVTAGAVANSINGLIRIRRDRIVAEATKLDSQYPILLNRD